MLYAAEVDILALACILNLHTHTAELVVPHVVYIIFDAVKINNNHFVCENTTGSYHS